MITEKQEIKNLIKSAIPTILMTRINFMNWRLYVQDLPFKVYSGLTGALSCVKFSGNQESRRVGKWRDKMIDHLGGVQAQKDYLNTMGDFGTILHEATVRMWRDGKLNWKEEQDYAYEYFKLSAINNHIEPNDIVIRQQIFEYCKNAASIMAFIHQEVDDIYAIESMAKCDEIDIATPIDMVVKLKDKRIVTINIKTSEQIANAHREQISVEKYLWNKTYDTQAHTTGILRPKNWMLSKVPTYEFLTLKPDEENKYLQSALNRLKLAKNDEENTYLTYPKETVIFTGETKLGENPTMETKTLEQIYKGNIS